MSLPLCVCVWVCQADSPAAYPPKPSPPRPAPPPAPAPPPTADDDQAELVNSLLKKRAELMAMQEAITKIQALESAQQVEEEEPEEETPDYEVRASHTRRSPREIGVKHMPARTRRVSPARAPRVAAAWL